ncbi:surface lipoprotein assembly modifier [Pseudomonas parafulva]|uniref:surface lipoprotein assembly modifier n=1 Tax=Pseudomonas parafulva TaxID=157782 RepID=UPI0003FF4B85|nr:surface lipoprotein assembly modifier [Pseudomonas parafulva]
MPHCYRSFVGIFFAVFFPSHAQSDQDTDLRLNQTIDYRATVEDRGFQQAPGTLSLLSVDGHTYQVGNNLDDLGRALYLSVQRQQWADVIFFRARYAALPDHDPMLLAYADGARARADGQLSQAEVDYRHLLALQPDFLPGQLELARVLFENRKDRESADAFSRIRSSLDPADTQNRGLLQSISSFTQALDRRGQWQGSLAVGPTWSNNLNRSSESRTTYRLASSEGVYVIERRMPKAVSGDGIDYEATLNKRAALSGHHGAYIRALAYGQAYKGQGKYNEDTLTAHAGYSYQNARNQYSLGPLFEFNRMGSDPMSTAWGLRGEWMHNLSATRLLKLEVEYKDLAYRGLYASAYNGSVTSTYATLWQAMPQQWLLFGGFDFTDRRAKNDVETYFQKGLRAGVAKEFGSGLSTVLFASWRTRQYAGFSAPLNARRHEEESGYTFIARAPRLAVSGLVPSLVVKYNDVRSNIAWLYSHERSSVSVKLEKVF